MMIKGMKVKKRCNTCGQIVLINNNMISHGYLKTTKNNDIGGSAKLEILPCGILESIKGGE